jgi:non-specific serine/threonine protein kinase
MCGVLIVYDAVAVPTRTTYDEAIGWGTRGLQLAREAGWRAGEAYALLTLGLVYCTKGDYKRAFTFAMDGVELAREIAHQEWLTIGYAMLGGIHDDILAGDLAIEYFEQSVEHAHESEALHFLRAFSGSLVDAYIAYGQLEQAGALIASFPSSMPMQTLGARRLWAARANWALTNGDVEEALAILDRLLATGHNVTGQQDIPLLAWRRGRALAQLGRTGEAEEALLAARAGSTALDQPAKLWRINLELARLYHSLKRSDDASRALQGAREIVERIAPGIPEETLREDFLSNAKELFDAIDDGAGPQPGTLDALLTPRESAVALLVARGLSNRQIGDELFIGERTVETHVGNILSKLGFGSRTQIAAWVHETSTPPRT